jgi:hypothetical protein
MKNEFGTTGMTEKEWVLRLKTLTDAELIYEKEECSKRTLQIRGVIPSDMEMLCHYIREKRRRLIYYDPIYL